MVANNLDMAKATVTEVVEKHNADCGYNVTCVCSSVTVSGSFTLAPTTSHLPDSSH